MKYFLHSKRLLVSFGVSCGLLFATTVFSQASLQWARFYGSPNNRNDYARKMVADDLGNVYITGASDGTDSKSDYVTIKYNSSGVQQWVARFDGFKGIDYPEAIAIDKWGNLYVTGYSQDNTIYFHYATVKYNNAGVQQWVARFSSPQGSARAIAMKLDKDANVYVTGYISSGTFMQCATVKYNSTGEQKWVSYYNNSFSYALAVDSVTSAIYVTGYTLGANSGEDYLTIKYDSSGVEQWARDYNGSANLYDYAIVIALDGQGNVYTSGLSRAAANVYECTTIKYSPSGIRQWVAHYSGPSNIICQPMAMVSDKFGNAYITGYTTNNQNKDYCVTLKYNSEGVQQWVQLYSGMPGGDNIGNGTDITLDDQGNIYVAGRSYMDGGSIDHVVIKYNSVGVQQWVERYDASGLINMPSAIAVNKFHDVFVAGSVRTYADNTADYYDFVTLKYTQPKPLVVTVTPDTTVYYGYGSNCVQLKAEVTGGVAPYTLTWSPGGSTPSNSSTTVCPTATIVYKVVVKDAIGTTDTAQLMVKVVDVRCGDKVVVCHNGKELCIAPEAVAAHLKHGDKLGNCSIHNNDCDQLKDIFSQKGMHPFLFKASSNPFNHESYLIYQLPIDAQVSIMLMDLNGREISNPVQEKKRAGYYVAFINGKKLIPGTYLCRMVVSSPPCQWIFSLKLIVVK